MSCIYTYNNKKYTKDELIVLLAVHEVESVNKSTNLKLETTSKVVDENGEPLVVYHGSPSGDITQFDRNKSKTESSGLKEFGSWFTTNKKVAELYANKRLTDGVSGNAIYPVFLNLRNLPEFDAEGKEWYDARRNIKADVGYKTATGIDAIEALAHVDLHHRIVLFLAAVVFVRFKEAMDVPVFPIHEIGAELLVLAIFLL